MSALGYTDFKILACQASIFTPDEEFSTAKIMQDFYPQWKELFDADPTVLPRFRDGVPVEIPRVILQNQAETWYCQFASGRVNLVWRKSIQERSSVTLEEFFEKAITVLYGYQQMLGPRIGRLAALLTRFARHDNPGLFLARHFCKDRWNKAPLNRPGSFELHAHKRFTLGDTFQVNSWARSKTGHINIRDRSEPIITFEQDINTLSEDAPTKSFSPSALEQFFRSVVPELDSILEIYYPREDEEK